MAAKLEQTMSGWMQTGEIPVHAALTADVDIKSTQEWRASSLFCQHFAHSHLYA